MSKSPLLSVLAFIQASYSSPDQVGLKVSPSLRKTKKKIKAEPVNEKPIIIAAESKKGTINAKEFLEALKQAGKRDVEGKLIQLVDPDKMPADQRLAIDCFCGYDVRQVHGTQLDNARRLALREINPVTPKEYHRGIASTVAGFVAGMPDEFQKQLANLQARERMASESMLDHLKESECLPSNNPAKAHAIGMATLEKKRLSVIRKEIKQFGQ